MKSSLQFSLWSRVTGCCGPTKLMNSWNAGYWMSAWGTAAGVYQPVCCLTTVLLSAAESLNGREQVMILSGRSSGTSRRELTLTCADGRGDCQSHRHVVKLWSAFDLWGQKRFGGGVAALRPFVLLFSTFGHLSYTFCCCESQDGSAKPVSTWQ